MSYEEVLKLEFSDESLRDHILNALKWVRDERVYSGRPLPPVHFPRITMSDEDMAAMARGGKFAALREPAVCCVDLFWVLEINKKRRRPIANPAMNDHVSKLELQASHGLPDTARVRAAMDAADFMIQSDFAAFYDQLPLAETVRKYFAIDADRALTAVPMGFRASVEVANAISLGIAMFPFESTSGASFDRLVYIDNILLLATDVETVERMATTLKERIRQCDATVNNDFTWEATTEGDFLGVRYDLVKKTRANTAKTLNKLQHIVDNRQSLFNTYKEVASVYGLLFFASEVAGLGLCDYFDALTYYRRRMSALVALGASWNAACEPIADHERANLYTWLHDALHAKPRPIIDRHPPPELRIFTDASATGWGAVSVGPKAIHYCSAEWSQEVMAEYDVSSSVAMEPLGLWFALKALVPPEARSVELHTDHRNLIFDRYSRSKHYNDLYAAMLRDFPHVHFEILYIKGEDNVVADALSRTGGGHGLTLPLQKRGAQAEGVAGYLGWGQNV